MIVKINNQEIENCMENLSSKDHITEFACKAWDAEYNWYVHIFDLIHDLF